MSDALPLSLLLTGAVGAGLIGGLFFAFSTFIMRAFDRLPAAAAVAAMQSINVTVLNPVFFLAFLGTAVVASGLLVLAVSTWGGPAAPIVLIGALAYLVGSFLVTAAISVPLNERLATVSLDAGEAVAGWRDYRDAWTRWNHVRTVASLVASAAFVAAAWFQ